MRAALRFLAGRRWAGVGLALLAELLMLVALSFAPPAATIGIQAAVVAAIAGTVAVVFGVGDGVAVAAAGAIAFAVLAGWGAGGLAAIGIWPAIVAAVGIFAGRVGRHRLAFLQFVDSQEQERRALALALHDGSAQTLTSALLTLRAGLAANEPATERARELINETIRELRELALELSPKALEDFGLAAALAHLADSEASRAGTAITFARHWDGRLSEQTEWTLFRFTQATLAAAHEQGADAVSIDLNSEGGRVSVSVATRSADPAAARTLKLPAALEERVRLLGGRLSASARPRGESILRVDLPCRLRPLDPAGTLT